MNNKLLTICTTRIRPHRITEMLESFDRTKSIADMVIYVADDDPCLEEYKKVLEGRNYIIGVRRHLVGAENYISAYLYPDYQYYQGINDDHVYHTPQWDEILINDIEIKGKRWGVACGRDLMHDEDWDKGKLPSAPVVSGNIVRTLGYLNWPELQHVYSDDYLRDIAQGINCFFRNDNVIIEHKHCLNGKAPWDDNYRWVTGEEQLAYGKKIYEDWVKYHKDDTVKRLLNAIRGSN